MELEKTKTDPQREMAIKLAWERGLLSYKLYDYQRPLYDALVGALVDPTCLKYTMKCARRHGKTFVLCIIALEFALQHPEVQINMATKTARSLRRDVNTAIKKICHDCPEELRPKFMTMDNEWVFKNGSTIRLAGTDGQRYENLRGANSHLNIIDEAGSCTDLEYILVDVMLPQTLTTGGKTLLASTPATSIAHDFTNIARECELAGHYSRFTVWDNTSLPRDRIEKYAKACGGIESTSFRREYLCEDVTDTEWAVVPEWDDRLIGEHDPEDMSWVFYHKYDAMDIGVVDLTALLFATYDFKNAVLWVEDEADVNGHKMTTDVLKDLIIQKETEVWGESVVPYRIADRDNLILLQDLQMLHGISFAPTSKDNLSAMVNQLREMIKAGRIKVSPKCKKLIACLQAGVWSSSLHNDFSRLKGLGHLDHLAALIYLVRNIDQTTNPLPRNSAKSSHNMFAKKSQQYQSVIKKILGIDHWNIK